SSSAAWPCSASTPATPRSACAGGCGGAWPTIGAPPGWPTSPPRSSSTTSPTPSTPSWRAAPADGSWSGCSRAPPGTTRPRQGEVGEPVGGDDRATATMRHPGSSRSCDGALGGAPLAERPRRGGGMSTGAASDGPAAALQRWRRSERTFVRVRWGTVVFAVVQVLTYYIPHPPGLLAVALGVTGVL